MSAGGDGRPNNLALCMDQWDVQMDLAPEAEPPAIQRLVGAGVSLWDNTNFPWTDVLDEGVPAVGTMLWEQGDYTAFKGKWHPPHLVTQVALPDGRGAGCAA
ncbi:hypothetical protein IEE92_04250 [Kocuria sp. cx-116]|uniref:hypothetical protein n=1 Tax=Kocuria sp. cx-116 TaxID=2771378 RepID=UPI001682B77D|nr:hypothetical protein [Kocuria sp. cx-116]MBD2761773.1 hypothetical protein [Kocuria sp. cx-116]